MKAMKINTTAFDATLDRNSSLSPEMEAPPAQPGFGQPMEPPHVHAAETPATPTQHAGEAVAQGHSNISVALSRPATSDAAAASPVPMAQTVSPSVEAGGPPAKSKPIWSRLRSSDDAEEPSSPAKRPNKQRGTLILAGVFLIGIVVGPWLGSKAVSEPPPAQGAGHSVAAIADTLKASALGVPVPSLPETSTATTTSITPPAADYEAVRADKDGETPKRPAGEQRYLGMLQTIKGGAGDDKPMQVVPKMEGQAPARSTGPSTPSIAPAARPAYPDSPIPLEIERDNAAVKVTSQAAASTVQRGSAPAAGEGRYLVLRIAVNESGVPAALMMPVGARAREAHWVFVGDATVEGFEVTAIATTYILLRAPSGRLLQLAPQG